MGDMNLWIGLKTEQQVEKGFLNQTINFQVNFWKANNPFIG